MTSTSEHMHDEARKAQSDRDVAKVSESSVKITRLKEDQPSFGRRYISVLDGGVRLEIEIKWWSLGRRDHSILVQPDGKRVYFDVDAIADKIIDRDLYPKVQAGVKEILRIDKEWRASKPQEFTDETGQTWRRA